MAEAYRNRDQRDVLKYMRVVRKEERRVNRVHQWCIFLCHGDFKGTELYAIERWMTLTTEGPDTAYFPINNPLIKISKNTEVPLEGKEEMHITPERNPP